MEIKAHFNEIYANILSWVNDLTFYKDELNVFQTRLEEVAKQNSKQEVMTEVEHFQNQFIRQHEVIDTLKHDLKKFNNTIVENISKNPVASDRRTTAAPVELEDQYRTFLKIYNELKSDFEKFLVKTY
jgi:uncharacterized protein (DUF2235 family)